MHSPDLPTGTVTFLFTDVEGSTQLWERYPDQTRSALPRHDQIIEQIVGRHSGSVVRPRGEGDSRFAVFARATNAVAAAAAIQKALHEETWPAPISLRVRMALHTGEVDLREEDYYGSAVNRCARLRSTAYGGQILLSRVTHDLVRGNLPNGVKVRDLGEHLLRDLQEPEHIFQLVIPGLPADFPPLETLDARPNNLPGQRSPLVGREAEIENVQRLLLRDDVGLLTLTGPGGIGKTRLALQVAANLIDEFPDGVFFVSLAHVTDPGQVASTIAQTLGARQGGGQEIAGSLADYLSERQLLLLLDNFEQVIEAAPLVVNLLAAAPRLKVLVTSREVLHVRNEQEFAVPPLGVPDPSLFSGQPLNKSSSSEMLSQYKAVALFIQRARLIKPDFQVTNENAPSVAEVCYRLDGLPLAIELAAARIRLLPPEAMLARLASRLGLLTAGPRDLPERQQTLRSTVQWSYDLLTPGEQMLFRRMAVFSGGATLEAIEMICNADGAIEMDVLDGVASLGDKSLVRQETNSHEYGVVGTTDRGSEPRFGMLKTIREYGTELLHSSEPEGGAELYRQHAQYYMNLAEQGRLGILGPKQELWLDRLETEYDNLQAATQWAIQEGDAQTALRLGGALWIFRAFRTYHREGYERLRQALQLPGAEARNRVRAVALLGASIMSWDLSDSASARAQIVESISIFRDLGVSEDETKNSALEMGELGTALLVHGNILSFAGEFEAASAAEEEGISLLRRAGNKWSLSFGLFMRGFNAIVKGDPAAARESFEESIALSREVGNTWVLSQALNSLGDLSRITGDYARAREAYEESLSLFRRLNAMTDVPASLHNLGHVALAQDRLEDAKDLFIDALHLQINYKNRVGILECLAGLAGVAGAEKQPERAARLFGAAEALSEGTSSQEWAAEQADYLRNSERARAQLDEATWDTAWQAGRAMTMEQAIAYAQEGKGVMHEA